MAINIVIVSGHLARDPELKTKEEGGETSYRASFTLGVNRYNGKNGKEGEADFPRVICFGALAKACSEYLKKGKKCTVVGRIRTGSYTKDDGTRVYTTDIYANRVEFDSRREEGGAATETSSEEPLSGDIVSDSVDGVPEGFQIIDDEDIPF